MIDYDQTMRTRCLEASHVLHFDPQCNMVPLFRIYRALERSRPGAPPTVDELVRAYNMDTEPGAAT